MNAISGALACTLILLILWWAVLEAFAYLKKRRERREMDEATDELFRRGFHEADARNWLLPYRDRLARFNKDSSV